MPPIPVQSAESQRIERILTSPEAKGREDQAQHLAFRTQQSADAAIATLKASGKSGAASTGAPFGQALASGAIDAAGIYAGRAALQSGGETRRSRQAGAHGRDSKAAAPRLDAGDIYADRRRAMGQEA